MKSLNVGDRVAVLNAEGNRTECVEFREVRGKKK